MAIELGGKNGGKGEDYFNRGLTFMKLKKYENARSSFTKALTEFSSREEKSKSGGPYKALYNLGIVYRHLDDLDKSI